MAGESTPILAPSPAAGRLLGLSRASKNQKGQSYYLKNTRVTRPQQRPAFGSRQSKQHSPCLLEHTQPEVVYLSISEYKKELLAVVVVTQSTRGCHISEHAQNRVSVICGIASPGTVYGLMGRKLRGWYSATVSPEEATPLVAKALSSSSAARSTRGSVRRAHFDGAYVKETAAYSTENLPLLDLQPPTPLPS